MTTIYKEADALLPLKNDGDWNYGLAHWITTVKQVFRRALCKVQHKNIRSDGLENEKAIGVAPLNTEPPRNSGAICYACRQVQLCDWIGRAHSIWTMALNVGSAKYDSREYTVKRHWHKEQHILICLAPSAGPPEPSKWVPLEDSKCVIWANDTTRTRNDNKSNVRARFARVYSLTISYQKCQIPKMPW